MTIDEAAARRSATDTPLTHRLKAEIAANGPIPVRAFLDACLNDPEHGYYRVEGAIGANHDFVTAPEISQIFGEVLGLWAAFTWQCLGSPGQLSLIELGPGRGTLMADMLRASRIVPGFHDALHIHLVEQSAPLTQAQEARLSTITRPLRWHSSLADLSIALAASNAPALVIGNEFLDTLPADQFVMTDIGLRERGVGLGDDGALAFVTLADAVDPQRVMHPKAGDLAPGDIIEQHEFAIFADLMRISGARGDGSSPAPLVGLFFDYGHEQSAVGDTLQAVRGHQAEPPLQSPGSADLTLQVDFAAAKIAAQTAGFDVDGPTIQASFLGTLGALERASKLMAANPGKAGQIEAGVARLMAPAGMGSRFKVLGLRRGLADPLAGF